MFEPFPALIAFTPLILYLLFFALIRFSGKSWVITGGWDTTAVLFAISGLVLVGPMELFFPKATAFLLGAWVWVPLLLLYFLFGCLFVISGRPKLVVYGRTSQPLFEALVRASRSIDSSAGVDHDQCQVHLPNAGAHLRLDSAPGHDCINIVSFEPMLPAAFWRSLRKQLVDELQTTPATRPRRGVPALIFALLMAFWLVRYVFEQPNLLADGFREWLVR
jgi:hypothetical protein